MYFKDLRFKKFFILLALLISLSIPSSFASYVQSSNKIKDIPIAMSTDDKYVYPTIVAITSAMENKDPDTEYTFYIMHPSNLNEIHKNKLRSLSQKYKQCHINLIDMKDKYKNVQTHGRVTTPAYYRLYLSELLPDRDKIIWIDGDTLTFHDLKEMYNIDMSGFYFKGFLDYTGYDKKIGIPNDHYICSGVMLINLKELRTNNMREKFDDFILKISGKSGFHDQPVVNFTCPQKNGILPAKFGIFNCIHDKNSAVYYVKQLKSPQKYTLEEVMNAVKDPWILHCVEKPWYKRTQPKYKKLWLFYAEKTNFF